MKLNEQQLDQALEIFQDFGPRRAIPLHGRWAKVFPEATEADMKEWQVYCREIENFAFLLAEQVYDKRIDQSAVKVKVSERFPQLTPARVGQTVSQAMYFAMR